MSGHLIVTGSAGGIGRSIATKFLTNGWAVTGIDRAQGTIRHERYVHREADITDEAAVEQAFAAACASQPVTATIANAAVTDLGHRLVTDLDYDVWRKVLHTNVDGAFLTARAAARSMKSGGNIVFVTSSLAFFDQAKTNDAPYCASKSAVEMLMRVMALELAPAGINVNTLFPSVKIATGFFAHLPDREQAELAPSTILDETALFLCGMAAGHLTGVSLDQERWDSEPEYRARLERGEGR